MPQVRLVPIKVKKDHLSPKQYKQALDRAMDEAELGILADYEKTVRTWNHKPPFYSTRSGSTVIVFTPSEIYQYVSEGTKPHLIFPRRARALRFRRGYRAKTTPGLISARAGGASGKVVFSKGVIHPGTKARNFHRTILNKWKDKYPQLVSQQLRRLAA